MTKILIQHYLSQYPKLATSVLESFSIDSQAQLLQNFNIKSIAPIFTYMSSLNSSQLLQSLEDDQVHNLLQSLPLMISKQCLSAMPNEVRTKYLKNLPKHHSQALNFLLNYPVDSVGTIMNPMVPSIKSDLCVHEVLTSLQKNQPKISDRIYIVDEDNRPIAYVKTKYLFHGNQKPISEISKPIQKTILARKKINSVLELSEWNYTDHLAVVNSQNVLLGELTHRAVRSYLNAELDSNTNTTMAVDIVNTLSELFLELTTHDKVDSVD